MPIDIDYVVGEITKGLPHEQSRILNAKTNLDYYLGRFDRHRFRIPDANGVKDRNERSSLFMQKCVNAMTSHLYRDNPVRVIKGNPKATDFLQKIYKYNGMHAKWQAADKLSMVGEAVAFQVSGTEDPENPIKVTLWASHSFAVFTSDDDPLWVEAVVTIDKYRGQDRYRLWTKDVFRTFVKQVDGDGSILMVGDEPNDYGILPFTFVHYNVPVIEFWSGSPGTTLREVNDYIIYRATELADGIKNSIYPKWAAYDVPESWEPPKPFLPGDFTIVRRGNSIGEQDSTPRIEALTPPTGFVEAGWVDMDKFINHSLECAGIPEAAIRMVQSTARSGASIAQEQAPLVQEARKRQQPFIGYETDLALMALMVADSHLRNNGVESDLNRALDDFELSIHYPQYYSAIPGPERDRADSYNLDNCYSSRLQVLQEREGMTRDDAVQRLKRVAEDMEEEQEILGDLLTTTQPPDVTPVQDGEDMNDVETNLDQEENHG